jgi:SAM-dependent methyltransferase
VTSARPAEAVAGRSDQDLHDVFDDPSRWRLAAVRSLGLTGADRVAGVVTGAAYPDALAPIIEGLGETTGVVCDVGAGLAGASQWIASQRAGAAGSVVAIEPESASVTAAAELFPGLGIVQGAATALPLGDGCAGGVLLLGVLSLIADLDRVLTEVARVLAPGGVVGITDLCGVDEHRREPEGSINVFRSAELLIVALEARGIQVTDRWTAPVDIPTAWDDVRRRVDDEITRRFAAEPAYEAWEADRLRLHDDIAAGRLVVETIVARRAG